MGLNNSIPEQIFLSPPNEANEEEITLFLNYCTHRFQKQPDNDNAMREKMREVISHRDNIRDDDLDFMHTLHKDGYLDLIDSIYQNVPEFWNQFERYKKEHDFCWNCAYEPEFECPRTGDGVKPTVKFIIKYRKLIVVSKENTFDHKNKGLYDPKLDKYDTECSINLKNDVGVIEFTACDLCIGNNQHLFEI